MNTGLFSFKDFATSAMPVKPKAFVSYHHVKDQVWYESFAKTFSDAYDIFTDTSLEREIDSDDTDYVRRAIREQNITGSSVSVVLCGAETWKRRWVDWEIQMTLSKQHALLGIALPTCAMSGLQNRVVPGRLQENIQSGFAAFIPWPQSALDLQNGIRIAIDRAKTTKNIKNGRATMQRSKP